MSDGPEAAFVFQGAPHHAFEHGAFGTVESMREEAEEFLRSTGGLARVRVLALPSEEVIWDSGAPNEWN